MSVVLIKFLSSLCKISAIQHPIKQRQGVTSVCVTSFGFLEAEPLVGEAGRGVELSHIMHRLPHPRDFVPLRLHRFPPPASLNPFSFLEEAWISMLLVETLKKCFKRYSLSNWPFIKGFCFKLCFKNLSAWFFRKSLDSISTII